MFRFDLRKGADLATRTISMREVQDIKITESRKIVVAGGCRDQPNTSEVYNFEL